MTVNGNWRLTFRFAGRDAELANCQDYHQEINVTRMHNPAHPGEVLKDGVFSEAGLTATQAAGALGVTRVALRRGNS